MKGERIVPVWEVALLSIGSGVVGAQLLLYCIDICGGDAATLIGGQHRHFPN